MQSKKTFYRTIVLSVFITVSSAFVLIKNEQKNAKSIGDVIAVAKKQYRQMLMHSSELSSYPRTADKNGKTKYVSIDDWTGGFWPGNLWYLYEYTNDADFKNEAVRWTESLEKNQFNKSHHDLGFMMYCSYGNAYRITQNKKYKDILIQSAKSLISRFNPTVGCIKSWDFRASWDGKTVWYYPVIMDNLMNLELLFFATKVTGDPIYRNVAIKHAETTLKNHVRKDYSSYHVVNYDSLTGNVLNKQTCQGYSDNSTWARGQAWGIYGYTMIYRETGDIRFLDAAKGMADFYMNHKNLPGDKVPYWDFNVNQNGFTPDWKYNPTALNYIPRDVSSAAIVSSALFELSGHLGKKGDAYKNFAISTINTLSSSAYLADTGTNGYFLLKHSVGSFPHGNEIDVPLVYADYYFLEALLRNNQLTRNTAP